MVLLYWQQRFHQNMQMARLFAAWVKDGNPADFFADAQWMVEQHMSGVPISREEQLEQIRKAHGG